MSSIAKLSSEFYNSYNQTAAQVKIQKDIDDCHSTGGGVVSIEKGIHEVGTLVLRAGVQLCLEKEAVLLASQDLSCYPILGETYNETKEIKAIIFAENSNDIGIIGEGKIVGAGQNALSYKDTEGLGGRPETILFRECSGVTIRDISIEYSSFWTIHLMHSKKILIESISIKNNLDRINTDGIDPDGCEDVCIRNCNLVTGDDCVAIKSTEGVLCRNIRIENCVMTTKCTGVKIGTEALANIEDVSVLNCEIKQTEMGVGLFMRDGTRYSNILFEHLKIESHGEFPIYIDNTPRYHGESEHGVIEHITFRNIEIETGGRLYVDGGLDTSKAINKLTMDGIKWRIADPLDLGRMGKPIGSVRSKANPNVRKSWLENAHVTVVNTKNSIFSNFVISADNQFEFDRKLLHQVDCENTSFDLNPQEGLFE